MKKPTAAQITKDPSIITRYTAHLAAKAEKNRAYRERRTNRELEAQRLAKALQANRLIDPTREEWLMRAVHLVLPCLAERGYAPTGPVKVSLGILPQGRKGKTYGQCFFAAASDGGYREIFIHPELTDTLEILGILVHELGHACLTDGVGHRKPFIKFCNAVGFDFKKAEDALNGEAFAKWVKPVIADLGPMPHKRLNCDEPQGGKKKQSTRMLLLECPCCGIKVRTARGTLSAIVEASHGGHIARCMSPHCDGEIDFEMLLRDLDEKAEDE